MVSFQNFPLILLTLAFALSQNSLAQVNGDQVENEIVVTAKRVPQQSVDVAGALSKLANVDLDTISAVHPAEALNTVAGVNIHRGSGQEHLTSIRSPVLTGGAGAGSFLYLEDGVPLRATGFANVNGLFESMSELAGSIEVVKGPGSVLYGSNAVHGLINVESKSPDAVAGLATDILVSSEGFARLKSSYSTSNLRIGMVAAHDNEFRADSGFDQQKLQIRFDGQLAGWDFRALTSLQNLNQETAGFIRGDDAYRIEEIALSNPNPEAYRDGQSARASIRLDKKTDNDSLITLIPYARWTTLDFLRHFVPGQAQETNGHKSLGILSSYAGAHTRGRFVLGIDAELTDGYLREFQDGPNVFSFVQGPHYDYSVKSTVVSAYAQTDISLSENLVLDLGARADQTNYDYDTDLTPGNYGRFQVVPGRSDQFTILTPKAALNYKFSDNGHAYFRYARGARAPQTSDSYSLQTQQIVGEVETEILDAFESGIKSEVGNFTLSADAYFMKKRNFFFRDSSGRNVSDGKTKHLGLELRLNGQLTDALSLNGNISFARHTYDFDLPSSVAANAITSGDLVDTAPEILATFAFDYRISPELRAGLEWRHVGKYSTDPGNTQIYPGHNVFVLRGRWSVTDFIEIYSRIDNLFDVSYADRADFAFGSERYFPGRPRSLFFGISAKY